MIVHDEVVAVEIARDAEGQFAATNDPIEYQRRVAQWAPGYGDLLPANHVIYNFVQAEQAHGIGARITAV